MWLRTRRRKCEPVMVPNCESALAGRQFAYFEGKKFGYVYMFFRTPDYRKACRFLDLSPSTMAEESSLNESIYAISYSFDGQAIEAGSVMEKGFNLDLLKPISQHDFLYAFEYYRSNA